MLNRLKPATVRHIEGMGCLEDLESEMKAATASVLDALEPQCGEATARHHAELAVPDPIAMAIMIRAHMAQLDAARADLIANTYPKPGTCDVAAEALHEVRAHVIRILETRP